MNRYVIFSIALFFVTSPVHSDWLDDLVEGSCEATMYTSLVAASVISGGAVDVALASLDSSALVSLASTLGISESQISAAIDATGGSLTISGLIDSSCEDQLPQPPPPKGTSSDPNSSAGQSDPSEVGDEPDHKGKPDSVSPRKPKNQPRSEPAQPRRPKPLLKPKPKHSPKIGHHVNPRDKPIEGCSEDDLNDYQNKIRKIIKYYHGNFNGVSIEACEKLLRCIVKGARIPSELRDVVKACRDRKERT